MPYDTIDNSRLDRREIMPKLLGDISDFLIVGGIAGGSKDVGAHAKDTSNLFLLGGAMGGAAMTALGLAHTQPDRQILLVTGDGELLMGLGSLATIGARLPRNLSILVVDNSIYGSTGDQPTHTSFGIDLKTIAEGCGIPNTRLVTTKDQVAEASQLLHQKDTPCFVVVKVHGGPPGKFKLNQHAEECKLEFRRALLGKR
jgi:thiamine pyrophosphate-dependent acetolactate synthase large subunit-like protein